MKFFSFRRRLRPVFQAEAAECGLACLAMVLSRYHQCVDLQRLREATPCGARGWTLQQLITAARHHMLKTRALRLGLDELKHLRCPAILHWDRCHFVVLEQVTRRGTVILDPAFGRRRLPLDEVSRHFTGVALECSPAANFRALPVPRTLRYRDLLSHLHGSRGSFAYLLLLSVTFTILLLVAPFYTQLVIDHALVSGDADLLTLLAVAFGVLTLLSTLVEALRSWVISLLGIRLTLAWSAGVFQHLLALPFVYFDRRSVGDIQSRFRSVDGLRSLFSTQVVEAVVDSITVLATLLIMSAYAGSMFVVTVFGFVLAAAIRVSLASASRSAAEEVLSADAERDAVFLNTLRSVIPIKNFAQESARFESFTDRLEQTIEAMLRVARLSILGRFLSSCVIGLQMIVLVWVGAHAVLAGTISIGMLIAFLAYARQFEMRSSRLVERLLLFYVGRVHLDRLGDITQHPVELSDQQSLLPDRVPAAGLRVRNVRFRYDESGPALFDGVSFSVPAGAHLVITGPSGSGKSTLIKILCGLLQATSGEIYVQDTRLCARNLRAYRQRFAVVMQNDVLFPGTLKDNLTLGQEVNEQQIWQALESVYAADIVSRMPMGLHSMVGELGDSLSGGERQRLVLARALCRTPSILFLDEVSNQLDESMRKDIDAMLAGLPMTRISVSHCSAYQGMADDCLSLSGTS